MCVYICVSIRVCEALGTVLDTKEALAVLVLSYGVIEDLSTHSYMELLAGASPW